LSSTKHANARLSIIDRTLWVGGNERHWVEVSCPTEHAADRRLLIAAHGSNQSPARLRAMSGYTLDDWAHAGHIVVYPQSWRGGLWNDARASTHCPARDDGIDDVAFIEALASQYLGGAADQATRAFGLGYSNGGQLLIRVVLETQILSAAALVAATMPAADNMLTSVDRGTPAIPMMLVHGTKDPMVPFTGGMASLYGLRPRGLMRSFEDSVAFWVDRAGLSGEPDTHPLDEDGRHQLGGLRRVYTGEHHAPVVAYVMTRGGHVIPNRQQTGSFMVGKGNHSIDTMTEFTRLVETT
jgi:polyhydroxybutyrate depolymerase